MMIYYDLWSFLCDLGKPLGVSNDRAHNRYTAAISLWMMELKIYANEEYSFIEFYDVLEAAVKMTIYKPQTLEKIFNNTSKENLIEGLVQLWNEKNQLILESQRCFDNIEDLAYYYEVKKNEGTLGKFRLTKVQMPLLIVITLNIMRTLKKRVKARKAAALELNKKNEQNNTQSGDFISEQVGKKVEETIIVVKPQDTPEENKNSIPSAHHDLLLDDPKTAWMKRIVKNKKPDLTNKHVALGRPIILPKIDNKLLSKETTKEETKKDTQQNPMTKSMTKVGVPQPPHSFRETQTKKEDLPKTPEQLTDRDKHPEDKTKGEKKTVAGHSLTKKSGWDTLSFTKSNW